MQTKKIKFTNPAKAIKNIRRGGRIFIGSGAAIPEILVQALAKNANHFSDNDVVHLMTLGKADYINKAYSKNLRHNAFFVGANARAAVQKGEADYTPIFLSEIPRLFRSGQMPLDAALVSVSSPDSRGFVSLGVSVDICKAAVETARLKIAQVNPQMPRALGDSFHHISEFDYLVKGDRPLPTLELSSPNETFRRIGRYVAQLIPNGATLQLGIGLLPDAVLLYLKERSDLGIHSEMFSDGIIELMEKGVITNKKKQVLPGKILASFCFGSKHIYDFLDNNPAIEFRQTDFTNDPFIISQNDNMIAINSALEVDLTGQICADSIGYDFYSGIGGQVDFIRGASRSKGGKPIIALPSTAKKDTISRIVCKLSEGAGVVTTRGDVHYVITEYGIAYLHGKSVRERAMALINVAHPKFRDKLLSFTKKVHYVYFTQKAPDWQHNPYPEQYEEEKVFKNNLKLLIRPIKISDAKRLQEFFYSHEEETIYHRYMSLVRTLSLEQAQELATLNYNQDMALIACLSRGGDEEIVAVGRYTLDPKTRTADIALVVGEAYQGKGIGKYLMHRLIEIGREKGLRGFTGSAFPSNIRACHLLESEGKKFGAVETSEKDGIYYFKFTFPK